MFMNISNLNVKMSSIIEIGERVQFLESESNDKYLKLHRGVMDVCSIDLSSIKLDLNSKPSQQYSGNDGFSSLISSIKTYYSLQNHNVVICPGGMATIDIVIESLEDKIFWIPKYHWGSWNKILTLHDKSINTFDEFDLDKFRPEEGIVMLCYPSNPTGWMPEMEKLESLIDHCHKLNITVILDLPYYHLFYTSWSINHLFLDNVIILSSFSKSIGLSGYRIGYVATLNKDLYSSLRVRSLYKYNSISNLPQIVIDFLLSSEGGQEKINRYQDITKCEISKNILYLKEKGLIWDKYPNLPIGPFCVVSKSYDGLMKYKISSVPLSKFSLDGSNSNLSRISVSVQNSVFVEYFDKISL